jgi:hypothetical protein
MHGRRYSIVSREPCLASAPVYSYRDYFYVACDREVSGFDGYRKTTIRGAIKGVEVVDDSCAVASALVLGDNVRIAGRGFPLRQERGVYLAIDIKDAEDQLVQSRKGRLQW